MADTISFQDATDGIDAALEKLGIDVSDLVWVQESSPIAVFRDGSYPVLRGTFANLDGKGLLYTRGGVPYYGTFPGLRVPRPLLLVPHEHSDSKLLTLAKEVLALTKVNWNTTQFDQKLPAPIKAARKVDAFSSTSSMVQQYRRISGVIRYLSEGLACDLNHTFLGDTMKCLTKCFESLGIVSWRYKHLISGQTTCTRPAMRWARRLTKGLWVKSLKQTNT
jgi:hypothetical protein